MQKRAAAERNGECGACLHASHSGRAQRGQEGKAGAVALLHAPEAAEGPLVIDAERARRSCETVWMSHAALITQSVFP